MWYLRVEIANYSDLVLSGINVCFVADLNWSYVFTIQPLRARRCGIQNTEHKALLKTHYQL
jgi:hypothetical protein